MKWRWKETFFDTARVLATAHVLLPHTPGIHFLFLGFMGLFYMNGRFFNILYTCSYFVGLSLSTSLSLSCFFLLFPAPPFFRLALLRKFLRNTN